MAREGVTVTGLLRLALFCRLSTSETLVLPGIRNGLGIA
jgi:hypothetical protein